MINSLQKKCHQQIIRQNPFILRGLIKNTASALRFLTDNHVNYLSAPLRPLIKKGAMAIRPFLSIFG